MKIEEIKTAEPFRSLFPIESRVLDRVQRDMYQHGYDPSQPIILWAEQGGVIDGHTRLAAARNLYLKEVPVHEKSFADEGEALAYAIHNQKNRRNLSEAELLRCIEAVDKRRERGGDRRSEDAKSKGANAPIERSAEITANIVGTSPDKVKRARSVLSDQKEKEAVMAGKKSINQASKDAKAKRKTKPTEPVVSEQDKRQEVLLQAWTELRAWRTKYNEYHELAAIFKVIDKNYSSKLKPGQTVPGAEGSHLPGELNEPSASPIGCEPPGDDQKFPNINNNSGSHDPAPDRTTEQDSPPSEIGEPEPDHMATVDPGLLVTDGHDLVQCGDCHHFTASSGAPGGRGHCCLGEKSWNGKSTQFAGDKHRCSPGPEPGRGPQGE